MNQQIASTFARQRLFFETFGYVVFPQLFTPNEVEHYAQALMRVVAHLPGRGKYTGMLGSLLLEMPDGRRFKLGTGFSDKMRRRPPPVGTTVTYKHYGKTSKGIPRFASFLRVRPES